jgi:SAM-dependent methyltransferase
MKVDAQKINDILRNVPGIEEQTEKEYLRFHIYRYIETLSLIPISSSKLDVLDVGTSSGHLAILVRKLFGYQVYGVDLQDVSGPRFSSEGIDLRICDISNQPLPYDAESFDVVLFCEILEHLAVSPYRVMNELWRVMKEDGILILSTPNIAALDKRLKLLVGRTPLASFDRDAKINFHIHEYTKSELASLIEQGKFRLDMLYLSDCWERAFGNLNPLRLAYRLVLKCVPSFRGCILVRANKVNGKRANRS